MSATGDPVRARVIEVVVGVLRELELELLAAQPDLDRRGNRAIDQEAEKALVNSGRFFRLGEMEHAIGAKYCGAAFRHDVMKIVSFCLIVRRTRIKRAAERRKDWIEGAARAVASAAVLRNLNVWLRGHPQWLEGHPHRVIELLPAYFESLAAGAQEQAEKLRGADRGGRRPMIAFASLVVLLADTFSRVTGRKATITWNVVMDRYEGPFWDLLDVVLRDVSDTPS